MRILITNDDGVFAEGIGLLALALKSRGYEVMIAAPSENQSCVGHGLTLRSTLYSQKVELPGLEDVPCYSITGTPVDCVRLSIGSLGFEPDVVVSGINHASNLGTDTLYSGTVSAALEASMMGYPAFAVSKDTFTIDHMQDAADYFADIFPELMDMKKTFSDISVLSVNIPSIPRERYKGIRVAPIAEQQYELRYHPIAELDGRIAYNVTSVKLTECGADDDTDERYVRDGYVVVTPLIYDLTDRKHLAAVKSIERDHHHV